VDTKSSKQPDSLLQPVKSFIDYLRFEKQLSPHTLSNYQRDLFSLIDFCVEQEINDWAQLDSKQMRFFASSAFRKGLGPRSIQRRLSASRSFFNFLLLEGSIQANPGKDVRAPKAPKRLPKTLDADQMHKLLDMQGNSQIYLRDKAMLELLYSSGLRLAELISLDIGLINFSSATLRVTGKGGKTRILPIGKKALEALHA